MPGVGIACPTVPGTTAAACAASGWPGFCAVPAGGVVLTEGVAAVVLVVGEGAGAVAAAAGVSPAAAKAIAHPISLIDTPGSAWNWTRGCAPDLRGSIGAGFRSLKRVIQELTSDSVEGLRAAA